MIYFIQSDVGGPIKIGHAKNPQARLSDLQIGSPVRLRIIGTISGDEKKEKELHSNFSDEHLYGEWFYPSDALISFLEINGHISAIKQNINPASLYINEKDVAGMTGLALQTLRNYRQLQKGPAYYKVGRSVKYKPIDVITFMEEYRLEGKQL